ncbi:hypothetical protein E1B28_005522 [Marasmius oreades]|uniref:Uncharacterized protein n=1 Tax=Marasmius oreades TaxID=181124 RepID=A0A9P7S3V4_9AGAR|nr:uncharacterized protein E1B28_005522 [Marasmius oreades]KAG7094703.1 hypothetical protein E1B28_005522 [Marasmius oreades]
MAIEHATGTYLYIPHGVWADDLTPPSVDTALDRRVICNYYHDVESVAWIYLWFLYHRFPSSIYEVLAPNMRAQLRWLYKDGKECFAAGARLRVFVSGFNLFTTVSPTISPKFASL